MHLYLDNSGGLQSVYQFGDNLPMHFVVFLQNVLIAASVITQRIYETHSVQIYNTIRSRWADG